MLASELIENAAVKAGLAEPGAVPSLISTLGLAALNRWYGYVWHRFPHRDIRIADATVTVPAGDGTVALPTAMDGVRSVRVAGGALLPLCEITEADLAALYTDASGTPERYVNLADGTASATVGGVAVTVPVRRIRLAPAPASALTLHVNGLRRFVPLAASDAPLLPRCGDALFYFVLAEFYEFSEDAARRKQAAADAETHLACAVAYDSEVSAEDDTDIPVESLFRG